MLCEYLLADSSDVCARYPYQKRPLQTRALVWFLQDIYWPRTESKDFILGDCDLYFDQVHSGACRVVMVTQEIYKMETIGVKQR